MSKRTLASFTAIIATCLAAHVSAQETVVADWTLDGPAAFTAATGGEELAVDSVGGHTFGSYFNPSQYGTFGGNIGGPSAQSTYFSPSGYGWYSPDAGTTTFPTTDFTISLYEQTSNLTQTGILFSSNGNSDGSIQIAIVNEGGGVEDFEAIQDNGSGNLDGTTLGTFTATTADTELSVTNIAGVYTFTDNGVNSVPVASTDLTDAPIDAVFLGIPPGAFPSYNGYMSDVTITSGVTSLPSASVPEPSTYLMMGLGLLTLVAVGRFRRLPA